MKSLSSTLRVRCLVAPLCVLGIVACGAEESREAKWADLPPPAQSEPESMAQAAAQPQAVATDRTENSAPVIHSVVFEPAQPMVGDVVRAAVEVTDPDGDAPFVEYAWVLAGRELESNVPKLILTSAKKGDKIELRVTASDGQAQSAVEETWVLVANAPPTLKQVQIEPGAEIVAGQTIILRPEARDRDGDAVSFRYEWQVNGRRMAEKGATLDTGELSRGDEILAVVVASDGEDDSEPLETPTFILTNTPPVIVSWPGSPGDDGVFEYQVEAEDPDGTVELMYELAEAPEGMEIGATTGRIRWEPSPDQIGSYSVAVVVDDLEGGRTKQVFELSTAAPDGASAPASPEY